jgi:hypothetical protein
MTIKESEVWDFFIDNFIILYTAPFCSDSLFIEMNLMTENVIESARNVSLFLVILLF